MKYIFEMQRKADMVHVLYDHSVHDNFDNYPDVQAKIRRLKSLNVSNNINTALLNIPVDRENFSNVLLQDLIAMGFKYAVFWFDGTHIIESGFERKLLDWCRANDDWFIASPSSEIDYTMVVVNLSNWDSEELFSGERPFIGCKPAQLSSDVAYHIRSYDIFDNLEFHADWIMAHDELPKVTSQLNESQEDLFAFKVIDSSSIYLTNSEPYVSIKPDSMYAKEELDTFILPCAGVGQLLFMVPHIHSIEHVIFYDFNPHSVKWYEFLFESWDGDNSLYDIIEQFRIEYIKPNDLWECYEPERIAEFHNLIDRDVLSRLLKKLKEIRVDYIQADICKNPSPIIDLVEYNSRAIINYTNIMQFEPNFMNNSILDSDANFYRTIQALNNKTSALYLQGDSPHGVCYQCNNVKSIKGF